MIAEPSKSDGGRNRRAQRSRDEMAEVSDIGEIPPIANPERRESCRLNLERFLVTYFPHSTGLSPFSDDHRRVIARMQAVCLEGGRQVNVVYRGFAKTTISELTAIWATIYGHRKFVPIFGAEKKAAEGIIDSIKMELETNDLLYEDFPEVCHAIRALEGKPQRQHSQHRGGLRTYIEFTANAVVLPTIAGSVASGAVLKSHGLTAAGRGMKHPRADGSKPRPDFVIIDDSQTEESAASPLQVEKRLKIIRKSILRMSGHRSKLAVVLNGTIIEPDDLVDQLSDYKRSPSWQSERIPMVRKFADLHEDFWLGDYARVRQSYDPELIGDQARAHAEANELYRSRREDADRGCVVSWESCYDQETELSAIQHAYNILIDDGADVFASECQNNPTKPEEISDLPEIKSAEVQRRTNGLKRGVIPLAATTLVIHVDVQWRLLYWTAFACNGEMTGSIVDRNTFPEQASPYFAYREAKRTLNHAYPGEQPQTVVKRALLDLFAHLFTRDWRNEAGDQVGLSLLLVDWKDGQMVDVIGEACRESPYRAMIHPAGGKGIGPGDTPMAQWPPKRDEKPGRHWVKKVSRAQIALVVDTNYWKSQMATALTCLDTAPGAVRLYAYEQDGAPADHRMLADHYTSESRDKVTSDKTERTIEMWKVKPNRDNHYWDTGVGCLVAASVRGCGASGRAEPQKAAAIPAHLLNRRFA